MPWKRKRISPWNNLPFGPDQRTFIPHMVVEIRDIEEAKGVLDHPIVRHARLTHVGNMAILLSMRRAWEVRWIGESQVLAVVVMLERHSVDGGVVSVHPDHVAMGLRDRAMVITPSTVVTVRSSDVRTAFGHLADYIIDLMQPEDIATLYSHAVSPPERPDAQAA